MQCPHPVCRQLLAGSSQGISEDLKVLDLALALALDQLQVQEVQEGQQQEHLDLALVLALDQLQVQEGQQVHEQEQEELGTDVLFDL